MPLTFSDISILLSRIEDVETRNPPFLPKDKAARHTEVIQSWFTSHRRHINELDIEDATALLSCILPERRTDRVYGIQALGLCRILGRGLSLSAARIKDLQAYKEAGRGDLAQCLERVLSASGPPALPVVSIRDVDDMLRTLASQCRFSGFDVTLALPSTASKDGIVSNIFKRISPCEGKWLVRIILKDLSPVRMNEMVVLKAFHFLLPDLLRFQNNFTAAVSLMKTELREYPERPDPRSERLLRQGATNLLRPAVGVKIGRPEFFKARSIEHCMKMLSGKTWALERKYDGEYCEVHVDLCMSPRPAECIRIFSKSGKDSTLDRKGLHQTLVNSLRLGHPDCKIKRQAIMLGELVVYSDKDRCVASFDQIRRHVTRSGVPLGTDKDSLLQAHEHLAIVFFDLLVLDDEILLRRAVEERRKWLREVYHKIPGYAMGAEWKIVDFSDTKTAKKCLVDQFAASIARRCEGLILKPCGVPYFPLGGSREGGFPGIIKLKKDYIEGMGDEADFAVVGASYAAQQAAKCQLKSVRWTDFHLGCIVNASEVRRFDARPVYKIVGTIQQEACIPRPILSDLNKTGVALSSKYETTKLPPTFDLQHPGNLRMDVTFDEPLVLEVLGSGFDKPSNCDFYMLRHARVKKLHHDRSWKDCVSFQDLQEQASAALAAPADGESQEVRRWLVKLEKSHKRKFERQRTPQSKTLTSPSTPSKTNTSLVSDATRQGLSTSPAKRRREGESELEGTALLNTVPRGNKRPRDDSNGNSIVQLSKRLRRRATLAQDAAEAAKRGQQSHVGLIRVTPLHDITNQVTPADMNEPKDLERQDTQKRSIGFRSGVFIANNKKASTLRSQMTCERSRCLFANSVVFLAPCILGMPYITEDLLSSHATIVVSNICHWDRQSFAHPPKTAIVSESQSYADRRKIILVEMKRPKAGGRIMQQAMELDGGRMRERIEVYDWRVLEECAAHAVGAEALKRHFLSATMFDEARAKTLLVSTIPWMQA